jgi:hypothetical protein
MKDNMIPTQQHTMIIVMYPFDDELFDVTVFEFDKEFTLLPCVGGSETIRDGFSVGITVGEGVGCDVRRSDGRTVGSIDGTTELT